jgi:hypothetical protein
MGLTESAKSVKGRSGHAQPFFFMSSIAVPQPEGKTSAKAYQQRFKEMLIRNCLSALAFFFQQSATSSQQFLKLNVAPQQHIRNPNFFSRLQLSKETLLRNSIFRN